MSLKITKENKNNISCLAYICTFSSFLFYFKPISTHNQHEWSYLKHYIKSFNQDKTFFPEQWVNEDLEKCSDIVHQESL